MLKKDKQQIDGWLIIDKPVGIGSTPVVGKIKHKLHPTKIGHAGTLDPLADGVLPIALGKATKMIPFVMDGRKIYEFQVTWGQETDTLDAAGTVTQTSQVCPTQENVLSVLGDFIGEINQLPPAYSALKVNGKRAYDLARAGQNPELETRTVLIERLDLIHFDTQKADFRVVCGKGTYVRSLGRDIGRKLGCLGYITRLRRVSCGPFDSQQAVSLEDVLNSDNPERFLLKMDCAVGDKPVWHADEKTYRRLSVGQRIPVGEAENLPTVQDGEVVCLMHDRQIKGLVKIKGRIIQPYRLFL